MLTSKYRPKKLDEIIGNDSIKEKIRVWILKWLNGEKQRAILLYGRPGVGKTSIAYALASEFNLQLVELSSSQLRDKNTIEKKISSSTSHSLFGKLKLILIDDIDAMSYKDRGGISTLAKVLSNPSVPIILTANDIWDKKLSPIRNEVAYYEMKAVNSSSIFSLLKEISSKENISVSETELIEIAKNSDGDVRAALNDLEARIHGIRDKKQNIFEVLSKIFKADSLKKAKQAYMSADVDLNTLKLWLSENIAEEYETPMEISAAYNFLSRADIFDGRISSRQYWGFMRYSFILAVGGVALAKISRYKKFTRYKFPSYLKQMSNSMRKRALIKSICKKIGRKIHLSPSRVYENIDFYAKLITSSPNESAYFYKLTDDEMKFMKSLLKLFK